MCVIFLLPRLLTFSCLSPGWIGSHIAHEALAAGLNIKLAIRNESKAKVLIDALEKLHGKGHIETVVVKDYVEDGAYDEAIKGVQGVVHAASDLSFSDDRDTLLSQVLKAYNSILNAANSQKSIRRFVLTSSSIALAGSNPNGKPQHLTTDTWYDSVLEAAQKSPNGGNVYGASKVLSERTAWDFQKDKKPHFDITSINPNANFGGPVPGTPILSTGKWLLDLSEGKETPLDTMGPQFHVDVDDVAKLHIIALVNESVKNERILAYGSRYTVNSLIDTIKKVKPDAPTPQKKEEWAVEDQTTVDVSRANELLKDQGGLRDMEYSIRRNLGVA
jgi:nucleoside-diphosphate-sugar epimerase